MTCERCELTELLVEQCACPTHRGGATPDEEHIEPIGRPFYASYDGVCAACNGRIHEGERIVAVGAAGDGYAHTDGCPP